MQWCGFVINFFFSKPRVLSIERYNRINNNVNWNNTEKKPRIEFEHLFSEFIRRNDKFQFEKEMRLSILMEANEKYEMCSWVMMVCGWVCTSMYGSDRRLICLTKIAGYHIDIHLWNNCMRCLLCHSRQTNEKWYTYMFESVFAWRIDLQSKYICETGPISRRL